MSKMQLAQGNSLFNIFHKHPDKPPYLPTRYIGTTSTSHHRSESLPLSLTFILGLVLLQASWDRPKKKWTHPALNESTSQSWKKNIPRRSHGSQSHGVLQTFFRGFSVTFPIFLQFGHLIFIQKTTKKKTNTSHSFNAKAPKPKSRRRSNKTWLWINPWNVSWVDGNTIYIMFLLPDLKLPTTRRCVFIWRKKGKVSQRSHVQKEKCEERTGPLSASGTFVLSASGSQTLRGHFHVAPGAASACSTSLFFGWAQRVETFGRPKPAKSRGPCGTLPYFFLAGWFLHYL